jgi:hypothetical protein
MAGDRRGLFGMSVMLATGGVACISAALYLTTDAQHTALFAGFGGACIVGALVLGWRAARGD